MEATLNKNALSNNSRFNAIYNIMAYLYIGFLVIIIMSVGFSPIVFLALLLTSVIFIIPSHILGINIIIFMTMIFERWFTLQSLTTEYSIYKIYPLDILIIVTILSWLIYQMFWQKRKIFFGYAEKILFLFIIVNIIYLLKSFYDINADFEVAFSTFKNYAFYPLLYLLVVYSIQTKEQFKNTLHIILLGGIAIISFIVIGFINGVGLWTEYTPLSTSGVRLLAGTHAYYLMITTIIGTSLLAFNRFRNKGITSLILIIWILGISVSLMRHLWLSLFVGLTFLLVLIPITNRKNLTRLAVKSLIVMITLAITILLIVNIFPLYSFSESFNDSYLVITERITSIGNGGVDTSIGWRLEFWQTAKKMWLESPIIGVGFGKKLALELGEWQTFEEIRNIHNSPLAITIQIGVMGIGLFGLFIITSLFGSIKSIFKDKELQPYYIGLFAAICAILFASLFQPYLETNLTGIFLWILLGLFRTGVIINKQEA